MLLFLLYKLVHALFLSPFFTYNFLSLQNSFFPKTTRKQSTHITHTYTLCDEQPLASSLCSLRIKFSFSFPLLSELTHKITHTVCFVSNGMEKKQGFFSALKEEVVRGFSPSRSRSSSPGHRAKSPMSSLLRRRKSSAGNSNHYVSNQDALIARSGSMRPLVGETLAPLMEGPDPEGGDIGDSKRVGSGLGLGLGQWVKGQLSRTPSVTAMAYRRSDLRLLLGVMGAPLAPLHVSINEPLPHLSIKDTPIVSFSLYLPLSISSPLSLSSFLALFHVLLQSMSFFYFCVVCVLFGI